MRFRVLALFLIIGVTFREVTGKGVAKQDKSVEDWMISGSSEELNDDSSFPLDEEDEDSDVLPTVHSENPREWMFEMSLSDCLCETGEGDECMENKLSVPTNLSNACFCTFDRHSGDPWPCYRRAVWTKKRCDTCNRLGYCPPNGPKSIVEDCYCAYSFCVSYQGGEFLKLWEYFDVQAASKDELESIDIPQADSRSPQEGTETPVEIATVPPENIKTFGAFISQTIAALNKSCQAQAIQKITEMILKIQNDCEPTSCN